MSLTIRTWCHLIAILLLAGNAHAQETAPVAETQPAAQAIEARPFFFALSVRDVERSAAWYQRVFDFAIVRSVDLESRGIRIRLLRRDGAFLELVESAQAQALAELQPEMAKRYLVHGVFKVGLVVASLDVAVERLKALEVPLRGKVVTEADGSMRSLQVEDPDGNVIQVFELLQS